MRNVNILKRTAVIFGKQHHEDTASFIGLLDSLSLAESVSVFSSCRAYAHVLSVLSHVFGAVDKTSSSFSAHGKIGNFIIISSGSKCGSVLRSVTPVCLCACVSCSLSKF